MPLIAIESPKQETVKAIFDRYAANIGQVPKTIELYSISPTIVIKQAEINTYFATHENLSFPLLCLIRYLNATVCNNQICETLNAGFLQRQGMSDDEIAAVKTDPATAPVEPREQRLLSFVCNAVADPDGVTQADIDKLHGDGWSDRDIFDAAYHGVMMVTTGLLTRIFKM